MFSYFNRNAFLICWLPVPFWRNISCHCLHWILSPVAYHIIEINIFACLLIFLGRPLLFNCFLISCEKRFEITFGFNLMRASCTLTFSEIQYCTVYLSFNCVYSTDRPEFALTSRSLMEGRFLCASNCRAFVVGIWRCRCSTGILIRGSR